MSFVKFPNIKEAMKVYLPTIPEIAAFVDDRVFYSVPDQTEWPIIVIRGPVFGGPDATSTPIVSPWFDFHCWAAPAEKGKRQREKQATDLALTLCGVLQGMPGRTQIGDTLILWAQVQNHLPVPDPDSGQARDVVVAEISALSTA